MKLSKAITVLNSIFSLRLCALAANRAKDILMILLLFASAFLNAAPSTVTFDSANTAYSKGDFSKSIQLYESISDKGLESSELYFNLGNAYFKSNNIALAILNYERAKKLNPDDEDIAVNLKLANQKIEDKIETAPQLFLTQWKNGVVDLMTEKAWAILCMLLIVFSLIFFAIFITSYNRNLKQLGFFGGAIFMITAIATFFIAQQKYTLTKYSTDAIITSPSVTVMGSPNEKGTKLFILHEGIKVNITQENESWTEIKIANGNEGWIKGKDLTAI